METKFQDSVINEFYTHLNYIIYLRWYFLEIPDNQLKRLTERVEVSEKHWKHNDGDWDVREKREKYHRVYESIFKKCNSPKWHIIPSDKNWYKTLLISEIVLDTLKGLKLEWPSLDSVKFKS